MFAEKKWSGQMRCFGIEGFDIANIFVLGERVIWVMMGFIKEIKDVIRNALISISADNTESEM